MPVSRERNCRMIHGANDKFFLAAADKAEYLLQQTNVSNGDLTPRSNTVMTLPQAEATASQTGSKALNSIKPPRIMERFICSVDNEYVTAGNVSQTTDDWIVWPVQANVGVASDKDRLTFSSDAVIKRWPV